MKCPTCDSPAPHLHPAMQHEGEVQICHDPYHLSGPDYPGKPVVPHKWDENGTRCKVCGDKDWMASTSCTG